MGFLFINLFYYCDERYDEIITVLDKYTSSNLTNFKHNNNLEFIDSSI
jgi:phosphopantothenate synthetase